MNNIAQTTFVVLGTLCIVLIVLGAGFYFFVAQDSATATYATPSTAPTQGDYDSLSRTDTKGTGFTINDSQTQALRSFGIDPESVPSSISAEQEGCFIAELGVIRLEEIKAGDSPSAADLFKAGGCL